MITRGPFGGITERPSMRSRRQRRMRPQSYFSQARIDSATRLSPAVGHSSASARR